MSTDRYGKSADEIVELATGHGACVATKMITMGRRQVGFMYRETPDNDVDSGWRFMSGYESDEYMDDASNHEIYDCNTIANYDPDIIPFLCFPIGSAFERPDGDGKLEQVFDFAPPE